MIDFAVVRVDSYMDNIGGSFSSPGCLSSFSLYAKQTKPPRHLRAEHKNVSAPPRAAVATELPLPGFNIRRQGIQLSCLNHPAFLLEQKLRKKMPLSSGKPSKFPDFQIINRGIPPQQLSPLSLPALRSRADERSVDMCWSS
jgi:hypothetical protein